MKIWNSRGEFFVLASQNLDYKHSLDVEMNVEEEENKIFKDYAIQKVRSIGNPRMLYTVEEKEYK